MKILSLHCDYLKFKPKKKAIKTIADLDNLEEVLVEEPLGIFVAVEKQDEVSLDKSVEELVKNTLDLKEKTAAERVVLYPYAHLSAQLSNPSFAQEVLEKAEIELKKKNVETFRAPFGYYKEFELKCKGHPLAELTRRIDIFGDEKVVEEDLTDNERSRLFKSMKKIKMQAPRGENNLKSNVELGRDLDLYIVSEVVGKGLPLLTPKGATIKRELERFTTDEELKRGYEYTSTPIMAKSDLFKISGHWQHYKDDMFTLDVYGDDYALRPMTCPFQFVLFNRKQRSYKDLPKKYAEISTLFRKEKTGELRGLTRLWQFTLADAHIICTPKQLEKEFKNVIDLIDYIIKTLKIEVWYRFSKWDSENKNNKYIDNPAAWEASQKSMKKILDKLKIKYVEADDEAAFYGPKLDLQYKDVYGKEDTLITVQIDFALPEKFGLSYLDEKGKEQMPMVIHRSSTGATERVMAYLLEKTQGNLPTWLSPIQVRVMSMNDGVSNYAKKIKDKLFEEGIRVDVNCNNISIGKKVKKAIEEKIPYILTVGDKEEKEGKVAVRKRGDNKLSMIKLDSFVKKIKKEIEERK